MAARPPFLFLVSVKTQIHALLGLARPMLQPKSYAFRREAGGASVSLVVLPGYKPGSQSHKFRDSSFTTNCRTIHGCPV